MLHCYSDTEFLVVLPFLFVRCCFVSIFRHITRNLSPNSFHSSIPLQRVSYIVSVHNILAPEKFQCMRKFDSKIYAITFVMFWIHIIYTPCIRWHFGEMVTFFRQLFSPSDRINANHTEKFSEIFSKNNVGCVCVCVQWVAFWCVLFQIPRRSTWHLRGLLCSKHIKCPTSNTHTVLQCF